MNKGTSGDDWSQSTPRAEMVTEVRSMDYMTRIHRFSIQHGKTGHIDDEVIVTLMLHAWKAGDEQEANTYASELLRRVIRHVNAHVRNNPGWQVLGGGYETIINDLCQEIVLSILQETKVPNHAEVAFGNYVYRRCLDTAGKLYAKKHSAGKSLDSEPDGAEGTVQDNGLKNESESPEQLLIEIEELLSSQNQLERIRCIVQTDLPELPRLAFTYRFFGKMKIESKKKDVVTVTSLMNVTEKTATKYINQAITLIKQRLSND